MSETTKSNYGGRRAGAGRKRKEGYGVLYARMSEVAIAHIKESATNEGMSVGEWIETHIP